jgi:dolichyl-phosphate-mannose--protein O-mannosyl transferase
MKDFNSTAEIACLLLGIVVMYLAMYIISRQTKFNVASFSALVAVLLGGVATKFLADQIAATNAEADDIWNYVIGLFVGLVAWIVLRKSMGKDIGTAGLGFG